MPGRSTNLQKASFFHLKLHVEEAGGGFYYTQHLSYTEEIPWLDGRKFCFTYYLTFGRIIIHKEANF